MNSNKRVEQLVIKINSLKGYIDKTAKEYLGYKGKIDHRTAMLIGGDVQTLIEFYKETRKGIEASKPYMHPQQYDSMMRVMMQLQKRLLGLTRGFAQEARNTVEREQD